MVWLLAPLAAVAEATQLVGLFLRLDAKLTSLLPVSLELSLFLLLIVLDACTYLLTHSLQAVVGWHARNGGGAATGELNEQRLRASIRLDLLLVFPVLLYATADFLLAIGAALNTPLFHATIGALSVYALYLALFLCAARWPRGTGRSAARVAMALGAAQLLALLIVSTLLLQAAEGGRGQTAEGDVGNATNRSSFIAVSRSDDSELVPSSVASLFLLLVVVAAVLRGLQIGLACWILQQAPRATTDASVAEPAVPDDQGVSTADASALVRVLSHEAVQHVVKGEVVSVRREGHPELRSFALFELESLSFRFSAQDAVGLDQMTNVEQMLLGRAPSSSRDSEMEAERSLERVTKQWWQRRWASNSEPTAIAVALAIATSERHRNALRINYLDAQGSDKCLEIVLGSPAARERWREGLSLLCSAVPWPTLPRGEALWARRVFNEADVAREGLLDKTALSHVLAAANTTLHTQQHVLPHTLAALPPGGKLSNRGSGLADQTLTRALAKSKALNSPGTTLNIESVRSLRHAETRRPGGTAARRSVWVG